MRVWVRQRSVAFFNLESLCYAAIWNYILGRTAVKALDGHHLSHHGQSYFGALKASSTTVVKASCEWRFELEPRLSNTEYPICAAETSVHLMSFGILRKRGNICITQMKVRRSEGNSSSIRFVLIHFLLFFSLERNCTPDLHTQNKRSRRLFHCLRGYRWSKRRYGIYWNMVGREKHVFRSRRI